MLFNLASLYVEVFFGLISAVVVSVFRDSRGLSLQAFLLFCIDSFIQLHR